MSQSNDFTPAAGRFLPTSAYDRLLAVLTREARWRSELLESLAPRNGERILDVGCGTGVLTILSAAPLLAQAIYEVFTDGSVTKMFEEDPAISASSH